MAAPVFETSLFSNFMKFRKSRDYEDLEGDDRVDMDITDPEMRQYMGMEDVGGTGQSGAAGKQQEEPAEGEFCLIVDMDIADLAMRQYVGMAGVRDRVALQGNSRKSLQKVRLFYCPESTEKWMWWAFDDREVRGLTFSNFAF